MHSHTQRVLHIGPVAEGTPVRDDERIITLIESTRADVPTFQASHEVYAFPWDDLRVLHTAAVLHRLEPFAEVRGDAAQSALISRLQRLLAGQDEDLASVPLPAWGRGEKRLLMVAPYLRFSRKAKEVGLYSVALWERDPARFRSFVELARVNDELFMFDVLDPVRLDAVFELLELHHPLDHVLLLGSDHYTEPVTAIAERYGRAANTLETVARIGNKAVMRAFLAEQGFSTVRYEHVEGLERLRESVRAFGLPCVVKPTNLSGSSGVVLVKEEADLALLEAFSEQTCYEGDFLVEEYLEGIEVSVESLTFDGAHHILGVTDKVKTPPPYFVELGHVHPSQLSADVQEELGAFVRAFLDRVGLRSGPAHTEVILTAHGPKIVESHARFGGDRLTTLVKLASGVRTVTSLFSHLHGTTPDLTKTRQRVSIIRFFELPAGRPLKGLRDLEAVRALPSVHSVELYLGEGEVVPEVTDSGARHGHVIVDGADFAEASRNLEAALSRIEPVFEAAAEAA